LLPKDNQKGENLFSTLSFKNNKPKLSVDKEEADDLHSRKKHSLEMTMKTANF